MPLTIQELMSRMPGAFLPEKAKGVDAIIQFHFTGEEPGDWYAQVREDACLVFEGQAEKANLTLTADSGDYLHVITGKLDGMKAFMQGKLKLAGDLNLAMKMMTFFKLK